MSEYSPSHTPKILIVDDSLSDILIMQKALAGLGDIYNAASGRQALDQIKLIKPQVVVLDIEMPDINGLEICQVIRDTPELSGTRVIFVTMHEDAHTEYMSFKSGADDFIMKPFNMNICRFRVQNQINMFSLARQSSHLMDIFDAFPMPVSVWTKTEKCLFANNPFIDAFALNTMTINEVTLSQLAGTKLNNLLWQKIEQEHHAELSYHSDDGPIRLLKASVCKKELDEAETVLVLAISELDYQVI